MSETFFKVLIDGRSCHGGDLEWSLPIKHPDGSWTPGEWMSIAGLLDFGRRGLHLTTDPYERWVTWGMTVYEAEHGEIADREADTVVTDRVRLLRPVPHPSWWQSAIRIIEEEIPAARWFDPDGEPDPSWRVVSTPDWIDSFEFTLNLAVAEAEDRNPSEFDVQGPYEYQRNDQWAKLVQYDRPFADAIYVGDEVAASADRRSASEAIAGTAALRAALLADLALSCATGRPPQIDSDHFHRDDVHGELYEPSFSARMHALINGACADLPIEQSLRDSVTRRWSAVRKGYLPFGEVSDQLWVIEAFDKSIEN